MLEFFIKAQDNTTSPPGLDRLVKTVRILSEAVQFPLSHFRQLLPMQDICRVRLDGEVCASKAESGNRLDHSEMH